ncbi:hypothetical protein ACLKA7_003284 [Drosophila subpalustris]
MRRVSSSLNYLFVGCSSYETISLCSKYIWDHTSLPLSTALCCFSWFRKRASHPVTPRRINAKHVHGNYIGSTRATFRAFFELFALCLPLLLTPESQTKSPEARQPVSLTIWQFDTLSVSRSSQQGVAFVANSLVESELQYWTCERRNEKSTQRAQNPIKILATEQAARNAYPLRPIPTPCPESHPPAHQPRLPRTYTASGELPQRKGCGCTFARPLDVAIEVFN